MNDSSQNHISLYEKKEKIKVSYNDIAYIEACGNYSIFYLKYGKKYVSCHPLKYYEELLVESSFFRINRSYIVNKTYIKYFYIDTRELVLLNKSTLFVSFRRRKSFMNTVYGNSQKLTYGRCIGKPDKSNLSTKI